MKAMIMAAGVGSRLDPLTQTIPKPLVPIVNIPVMEHHLNWLASFGIKEVVANLWHLPAKIKKYFGNGKKINLSLRYSWEKNLLGTAGGVKKMQPFLKDGTFLVSSADVLTDFGLNELYRFHKKNKSLATIALKEVKNTEQFGIVIIDKNGHIISFQEKPKPKEAKSNLANAGIYIFEPEIFRFIPQNKFYDFGRNVFPHLVRERVPFFALKIDGYWRDVGTFDEYQEANFDVLNRKIKVKILGKMIRQNLWAGENTQVEKKLEIKGKAVCGKNCQIGKEVKFKGKVIMGNNCKIENNVYLEDAIIWENISIGKNSKLSEVIIGSNCKIKEKTIWKNKIIV